MGISRATTLTLYFLMTCRDMKLRDAWAHVKSARPPACPSIGFMAGLVDVDVARSGEGKASMTLDEYRLHCCRELFPSLSDEVCSEALSKAKEKASDEAAVQALIKRAGTDNLEPLGFMAIDLLIEEYPDSLVRRS